MLRTKIKASAINNLTDARYFAAREVEWLGFRLSGDPGSTISPMAAKAIAEWVDGVKIVGELDFPTASEVEGLNDLMHFDAVQVGMYTSAVELRKLPALTFIKEVVVQSTSTEPEIEAHFQEFFDCCAYFLLDFTKAGIDWSRLKTGAPVSIDFLKSLSSKNKIILALEFQPDEALEVLEAIQPEGLSLLGGGEEKVGLKSFDKLEEVLDQLELAV